ncbi:zinc finger protein 142-like [Anoplophora glabripennis]|uniref:zinc finger protein 142-like n=1 Tax=Anoplophora glabripennis TaxID=217634 RepID=UPI000873D413|nr:zinc finger protein 142-like [Anoplophora glabripennis]
MGNFRETLCRLCHNAVSDGSFKIIEETVNEVLNVLLLKLNIEENKSVICNSCSTKLFAAFDFKMMCMGIEDTIFRYANSENAAPVDLTDIYVKEKDEGRLRTELEGDRICRLCMNLVTCEFTSVKVLETDLIHNYIPEVNFSLTKEPVICSFCLDFLNIHGAFLNNCLDIQERIKYISDDKTTKDLSCVKIEEVEIKTEVNDKDEQSVPPVYADELVNNKAKSVGLKSHQSIQENPSQARIYRCYTCTYESRHRSRFVCHQLSHRKLSEVPTFKCDTCSFLTKYKSDLKTHQLKHKDLSKVEVYKCDICDFETKYRKSLSNHHLTHKDSSEIEMYTCDKCDFTTKHQTSVLRHRLIHTDFSETQMYSCDLCDFTTKYKNKLKPHQLKHADPSRVQMYTCGLCDFTTKYKHSFKRHQSKHTDSSKGPLYSCDMCPYKSSDKWTVRTHQLVHKDSSMVQMYTCDLCDYKTKHKNNLKRHKMGHESLSQLYK